jgi:PKD repeat protein
MTTSPNNRRFTGRGVQGRGRAILAGVAALLTLAFLAPVPAAQALVPVPTLAAATVPGNPTVTFTGTAPGAAAGDTFYLCFGDEVVACGANAPGTATTAAVLATGVTHAYAKSGTYNAVLFVVEGANKYSSAPPLKVAVTVDPTAALKVTTNDLVATFNGNASTALAGDLWWACFGDTLTCSQVTPDAHGTAPGVLPATPHTYAKAGTYPATLTVTGPFGSATASQLVTVAVDPTALLSANATNGSGTLTVTFDGSKSTSSQNDRWAFCYGDNKNCSQTTGDVAGTGAVLLPTAAHVYQKGNYTATLWVRKGATTSTATLAIAVSSAAAAPDGTCTLSGLVRTCDLYAKRTGTVSVGGEAVPFWGFTTGPNDVPVLGGPRLVATEGETLNFALHNQLDNPAGNVSITVASLSGVPDLTGITPGQSGPSGSFALTRPGTYIYEAGLTPGGERQVAMGLSGLLIVRPAVSSAANAAKCAYDSAVAATTDCVANHDSLNYFDREKDVVVNDIDPEFNQSPFTKDMTEYHPTYFFLDGVAYDPAKTAQDPGTSAFSAAVNDVRFDVAPGDTVLVRYANLGLREHSLNLVNLLQTGTASDGHQVRAAQKQNTEFLNAGQSGDTFIDVPANATTGAQYPLYDAGFHLNNGASGGLGGIYSYFDVVGGVQSGNPGPIGSATSAVPTFDPALPSTDNSQVPSVTVKATFSSPQTTGAPTPAVVSVGWALDAVPALATQWQPVGTSPVPTGSPTASVTFAITADVLTALLATEPGGVFGDHIIWLQATDANGKQGPPIGATFTLAARDPIVSGLALSPAVTNGSTDSAQLPVASTKVGAPSDHAQITTNPLTLSVASTAGFPGSCVGDCQFTAAVTIAGGPSQGQLAYETFSYTALTATTFIGVRAVNSALPANVYEFRTGNGVALDVVPAGFVAVNGTATAAIPGWVVTASQACVVPTTGATPTPADGIDAQCAGTSATNGKLRDLSIGSIAPLTSVGGFFAPPTITGDAAGFWVLVRALEGPDGDFCATSTNTCRWSPWVHYNPPSSSTYTTLTVVSTGPSATTPTVAPDPNNGFQAAAGNLGLFDSFDVTATVSSPWAAISLAEVFVSPTSRPVGTVAPDISQCTVGSTTPAGCVVFGQGAEMTTATGLWGDARTVHVTAFLPLSELQGRPDGLVRIWVHGRDVAGNWGPMAAVDLTIDHTAPVLDPAVSQPGSTTSPALTAHDVLTNATSSGIAGAEWFVGTDPGPGNGTKAATQPGTLTPVPNSAATVSFSVTGLPAGRTVNVRVRDAAGNWSLPIQVKT